MSQKKLAEKTDLSTVFISRSEQGKESPSVDNLAKTARFRDFEGILRFLQISILSHSLAVMGSEDSEPPNLKQVVA
jgi:transcriptional regulator with XRE-family HTH domain